MYFFVYLQVVSRRANMNYSYEQLLKKLML
jgi:hypothetical protein